MKCIIFASSTALALLLSACTSDKEEDVAPQPQPTPQNCDVSDVTYALTVMPILKANCYTCHSAGTEEANVVLNKYDGLKKQADNGHLVGVITHASGFPPMPQGAPKLSDCDIARIKKWVAAGAPNN